MSERTYASYRRARTPLGRWLQRRRRQPRRDDGRLYVGWTAVSTGRADDAPWPAPGARGSVESAEMLCGELAHHLVFPTPGHPSLPWRITVPLHHLHDDGLVLVEPSR